MSTCVRGEGGLWRGYRQVEAEGHQAILYSDHVSVFQRSPGALGELIDKGEWREVGHIFSPASHRPDRCQVCNAPQSASTPEDDGDDA